jgi:cyclophilin family peptidyl-prolyl cis-trans isomerase/HEAT repeat protein
MQPTKVGPALEPVQIATLLALLIALPAASATSPDPLTTWNEPGITAPVRPLGLAPAPPKDPQAREAWAEIAMLEDTRSNDLSRLMGFYQSSQDSTVRWRVCRAYARLQDSTGVLTLLDALQKDPSPWVRQEAAFALGQVGSRMGTQALIYAVREQKDRRVRGRALEALGKIGDPEAHGVVTAMLTNPDPELSREAALACWRMSDSTAASYLAAASKSKDAITRAFCAYAMEKTPRPAETLKALGALVHDKDVMVRAYTARALAKQRDPRSLGHLLELAADKDWRVRIAGVRAIGAFGDSSALPQVIAALRDDLPGVRETAATAAQQLRSRDAAPALRKGLEDSDPAVRLACVRALVALLGDEAYPDVRKLLADGQRFVRAGTIEQLGQMKGEDPRLMLQKVAAGLKAIGGSATAEERASAFSGIAAARSKTARAEILSGLSDANWLVAASAAEAAGASGDSTLAPNLIRLGRHNPDPRETDVPLAVYAALESLGPGAAGDSVRAFLTEGLTDKDPRQRTAAASAYGAVFGAAELAKARTAHPAPPWQAGILAEYRAELDREDKDTVSGATIHTVRGDVEIAFDTREAPRTVNNFVTLAEKDYFKDVIWHRVVPYFVAQDGDPTGTGSGGPGYAFRCEYNGLRYDTGAVGMALSGKDTGGSQYFITLSPQPHLDGRYTIFGHVVKGQDVVERLRRGDRISSIAIHRK